MEHVLIKPEAPGIHASRFGFHPCSWQVCQMLKRLNYHQERAWRQFRHWQRWQRKHPRNRMQRAPIYGKAQDRNGVVIKPGIYKIGWQIGGPIPEPTLHPDFVQRQTVRDEQLSLDHSRPVMTESAAFFWRQAITEDYRNARTPRASGSEVRPLLMDPSEIRSLLLTIEPGWSLEKVEKSA